jgi:hypothetical protein
MKRNVSSKKCEKKASWGDETAILVNVVKNYAICEEKQGLF